MDAIKEMAIKFSTGIKMRGINLENFDSELTYELLYINNNREKLRFLSYLKDIIESNYQKHAKVCKNPSNCTENKSFEIAIYSIKQQYKDYYEAEGNNLSSEHPSMKFFADGQYFDAFTFIKECVKEAKSSIVLIDGYIDENTLAFFPGKETNLQLRILTKSKSINPYLERAVELYNRQYGNLRLQTSDKFHDRFLILDDRKFYHIGASIKDAGNKSFMFSHILDEDIMNLIRNKLLVEWGNIYEF